VLAKPEQGQLLYTSDAQEYNAFSAVTCGRARPVTKKVSTGRARALILFLRPAVRGALKADGNAS